MFTLERKAFPIKIICCCSLTKLVKVDQDLESKEMIISGNCILWSYVPLSLNNVHLIPRKHWPFPKEEKKREIAQFDSLLKTKVQIAVDLSTPRSANLLYIQAVPYMWCKAIFRTTQPVKATAWDTRF